MQLSAELAERILQAISDYIKNPRPTNFSDVLKTILEAFLSERGYLSTTKKRLRVTLAEQGSGHSNTAINHNEALAELNQESSAGA